MGAPHWASTVCVWHRGADAVRVNVPHTHRAVTTDLRRGGVVFNNEHFAVTYVERGANEPIPERQERGTHADGRTHHRTRTRGTHIAYLLRAAIAEAAAYVQSFLQERWEAEQQQQQLAQAKGEKAQSKSGAKTEVSSNRLGGSGGGSSDTAAFLGDDACRARHSSLS